MTEPLLLNPETGPRKPVWRKWKWIGLTVLAAALLLRQWLPGLVVFGAWVYGIVVIANLAYLGFRYLKNKFFWRVRNRIAGSLVFVGVIPLVLLLGTVYAAGYLLAGQLGSKFLAQSLEDFTRELAEVNGDIGERLPSPELRAAEPILNEVTRLSSGRFPRLAARLVRRTADAKFETVWRHDPSGFLPQEDGYPAEKWMGPDGTFQGILAFDRGASITVLRPIRGVAGHSLEVSAPLDAHIQERLQLEKSLYVFFAGVGTTAVRISNSGVKVDTEAEVPASRRASFRMKVSGEGAKELERELERKSEVLKAALQKDGRRMISWGTIIPARKLATGEEGAAGVAVLHVPLAVLYDTFIGGAFSLGKALLTAIWVLAGLFAIAELISVIIGITISRRVTKSIDDMYRGILALQKGDLQHRIPVRKDDQLGLLAHSFNQMSASITHLLEEVTEKKRLEQELEIAREVQATLFPKHLPRPRGLEVFGGCEPARVVSGDYYDFIIEDEARLHIVVGDISGKGISAALMMANLQAAMRDKLGTFSRSGPGDLESRLSGMMTELNEQVFANSPSGKYVTLFSGRYDAETRRLCYCNAGHLPPLVLSNGEVRRLETGGTVLGLFGTASYESASVELPPGSLLAIFTDGVTEAVNHADEEFGEERLLNALRESRALSPELVYKRVTELVTQWQGNLKQQDDITLIVAKVG